MIQFLITTDIPHFYLGHIRSPDAFTSMVREQKKMTNSAFTGDTIVLSLQDDKRFYKSMKTWVVLN